MKGIYVKKDNNLEIYEGKAINKNRYIIRGKNKNIEVIVSNVRRLQKLYIM